VVVTSYLKNMLSPMKTLAKLAPSFTQGAASAERIADILDQPTEHLGTGDVLPARVDGKIHTPPGRPGLRPRPGTEQPEPDHQPG